MARTARDCALLFNVVAGHDPQDSTSLVDVHPISLGRLGESVRGLVLGLPRDWVGEGCDPEVRRVFEETVGVFESRGVRFRDVSLPKPDHSVASYYILADAEASSNLARYDGVRYGPRLTDATDLGSLYGMTRGRGFGPEVKRRIILGTYVLSAGYYEAYYLRAQRARRLIRRSLDEALAETDALLIPTSPTPAFHLGEKIEDPLAMYLSDIYTITANLAGYPALSLPAGITPAGLPVGMQLYGKDRSEGLLLMLATAHERATDTPRLVTDLVA
jgi:aspartyl-tRNA(Asn)/glutamyl-tRNA(Gln) amidotransferase subunit A